MSEKKGVLGGVLVVLDTLSRSGRGIYSGESKTVVGDTLSHTRVGHPVVHGCPGVHKGSDVQGL